MLEHIIFLRRGSSIFMFCNDNYSKNNNNDFFHVRSLLFVLGLCEFFSMRDLPLSRIFHFCESSCLDLFVRDKQSLEN